MSELKAYIGPAPDEKGLAEYYLKSEADKVIAELKDKCQMHNFFWEGCGFAKRGFKNTIAVSEAYDNLEATNERLLQLLNEAVQAQHFTNLNIPESLTKLMSTAANQNGEIHRQRREIAELKAENERLKGGEVMKFVCEKCAHEIGGMPPYERFKAFCPNCKKLAWFTHKKLNQSTAQ